tara:strand:- start:6435 stop:7019 length:585 start_codon:yes stop_codon:yes gene_type:complete
MNSIINILSKNPDKSDCKSRLRYFLSNSERIYLSKKMLEMTCDTIIKVNSSTAMYLYPNKYGMFVEKLSRKYKIDLISQENGYLSDKIYFALNNNKRGYEKRIVIGSDIPTLSSNELNDCLNLLDSHDLVLGPSKDGGFYLVGVKHEVHSIFKDLNLNTILTNDLLKLCEKNSIKYKLIRTLKDIDEPNDLLFI